MTEKENHEVRSVLKSIASLQQFKLSPSEAAPIYHDAYELPAFLVNNLKSQHRRVKQFSGEDAIIQAFYYNLMKLAFEIEVEHVDYPRLIEELLIGFAEFGPGELEDKNFSDHQYRQFLKEFMDILQGQQIANFEETIKLYPIINEILLKMFRQLVPVTLLLREDEDSKIVHRVFAFLTQKFQITLELVGGCFKFVQSDIFIYVGSTKLIYLIFDDSLGYIKEVTEYPSSSLLSQSNHDRSKVQKLVPASKKSILSHESQPKQDKAKAKDFQTVINILDSNKMMGSKHSSDKRNSFDEDIAKSAKIDNVKENGEEPYQEYYGQPPSFSHHSQRESAYSIKQAKQPQIAPNFSSHTSHVSKKQTVSRVSNFDHSSQHSQASNFSIKSPRKPAQFRSSSKLDELPNPTSIKTYGGIALSKPQDFSKFSSQIYTQSKPSNLGIFSTIQNYKPRQQSKQVILDDSGYDKFTNSKVLVALDEQYREQIRMIKKKYRAERANIKNYL